MPKSRITLMIAAVSVVSASAFPTSAGAGAPSRCQLTLAQYTDYAKRLQLSADRARQQADENPIYESDVQYYAAELGGAQQCIRNLTPVTAAAR
jgi:hypothetical protein